MIGLALAVVLQRAAQAGIFSSVSVNQDALASYSPPHGQGNAVSQSIVTGTLPVNQTLVENDLNGGVITATYNITDNGSVATYDISVSGTLSALNNSLIETSAGTSSDPNGTVFSFSQPVGYSVTISDSGPGNYLGFSLFGAGVFVSAGGVPGQTSTYSGTANAGSPLYLSENWELDNPETGSQSANLTGSDSISLTFTAVPEPSSALVVSTSAAFFLSRRRRKFYQWSPGLGVLPPPVTRQTPTSARC
jgi:hypothetical protein